MPRLLGAIRPCPDVKWGIVQPPDAEDRTSGGVGGSRGAIPVTRPDPFTVAVANTANITFRVIEFEALLILLDQKNICASSDSACLADSDESSHVVRAMKPDSTASRLMIRFSLDAANTATDMKNVLC